MNEINLSPILQFQIQLGIYYIFWMEIIRLFPRENILILHTNELKNVEATVTKMYDFLDLRKWNYNIIVIICQASAALRLDLLKKDYS